MCLSVCVSLCVCVCVCVCVSLCVCVTMSVCVLYSKSSCIFVRECAFECPLCECEFMYVHVQISIFDHEI